MESVNIKQRYNSFKENLPSGVSLILAAKTRSVKEIREVIFAGAKYIGENYVQEALEVYDKLGDDAKKVKWHMIGHLQRNKVKKAIKIFDMIESLDSLRLAKEVNKRCKKIDKVMPVLVEINSGQEKQKTGIYPQDTENFIKKISKFNNIKVMGLMTMGPMEGDPEYSRTYFIKTKKIFDRIKSLDLPNVKMEYLSMGMTNSYKVAIEEGSNMVRIGTAIFGARKGKK